MDITFGNGLIVDLKDKKIFLRKRKNYKIYKDDEIATPLLTQLSWTNNLLILISEIDNITFFPKISSNCIKNNQDKINHLIERNIDNE